jgi:hypothetical protein
MIELDVCELCHDCPNFEPATEKLWVDYKVFQTIVRCSNMNLCGHLLQFLEKKTKEKDND